MKKRLLLVLSVALLGLLLLATPAFAIADPDSIAFGTGTIDRYKAFYDVYESGDMLFIAETDIAYASTPDDYKANEAFSFVLMSTDNATVYASVGVPDYENKVVGIYQTAAQVTALSLASGTSYNLRITGNPTIFNTLTKDVNMVTKPLSSEDWIDQSVATTSSNPLRDFIILVVEDLEAHDSPTTTYITTSQGVDYLSTTGGNIFLDGIPNLRQFCPSAFATATSPVDVTSPPTTGALQSDATAGLTPELKLGTTTATALTNLGSWLGIPQRTAGSLALLIAVLLLSLYISTKTGVKTTILVVSVMFAIFGMYLGLISLAVGFIAMMAVIIGAVYYYFARGAAS